MLYHDYTSGVRFVNNKRAINVQAKAGTVSMAVGSDCGDYCFD
jgi:hypothetical protein